MKQGLRALLVYRGDPVENPRKALASELPIKDIEQVDIQNLEEKKDERYDIIAVFMCLQTVAPKEIPEDLIRMHQMLNLKGELYVTAPSFEWAAAQVETNSPHPFVHMMICGTETNPHRSILTLGWLRNLMSFAGFNIRLATTEKYSVQVGPQQTETLFRDLVIGWKLEERDAAGALDSNSNISIVATGKN